MATALLWFRRDLRLADNPALTHALAACERVIPVYIHAPDEDGAWAPGAASNWWLHYSLLALDRSLRARGARLIVRRGTSLDALQELISQTKATHVVWNRLYEPSAAARDNAVQEALRTQGIEVAGFNATLLNEPRQILKDNGEPYRVFTAYWKASLRRGLEVTLAPPPQTLPEVSRGITSIEIDVLGLRPHIDWAAGVTQAWPVGEDAAHDRLETFVDETAGRYDTDRNRPDVIGTSRLSPHLHFGEIGPRQVVSAVQRLAATEGRKHVVKSTEAYVRQLGWRDFAHQLLHHFSHTTDAPLDQRFERFPWANHYGDELRAWQRGQTGIPIVDAGMRELWHTGWMHNRVRMIVASLLTKNLLVPWQEGARWFWDTLVDADLANNTLGWQWVTGCGADAAPYFRIFNPVVQGEKFDPKGRYVRRWVPEIAGLPNKYLHKPWSAPSSMLDEVGVTFEKNYPRPIVDIKRSRERALESMNALKG